MYKGAAAAAAVAARPGPTTAQCRLEPSNDLPRRGNGNDRNKKPQAPKTQKRKVSPLEPPTEKSVTTPETPGQDDDPDRIDDVSLV